MGKIYIAGVGFEVDARVVRWDEGPRFDGHAPRCINPSRPCPGGGVNPFSAYLGRARVARIAKRPALRRLGDSPTLRAAQAVIRQFVVHHDGCPSAASCYNVLHNERGLSCHFLLDNDGTIYQTVDLAYMAFHAAGFNASSVGIELCNRGDAKRWPDFYRRKGQKRDVTTCRIHGHTYLAFDYTLVQYEAMRALVRGLVRALPNLPAEYPQESPGYQSWGVLPGLHGYAGLLGHYHTTRRKWDPGPFDFKRFCESIRGRMSFPLVVRGDKPDVPKDTDDLRDASSELFRRNEVEGEAGFFPIAPTGDNRLWHGGVHLPGPANAPVYAPFPGRVMAVRMGTATAVGSANLVLMRHDMSIGPTPIRFFSLYFHLADERGRELEKGAPRWMASPAWRRGGAASGGTILLDEPVEAGDTIGRVGMGGPDSLRRAQIHFEVFASDEILGKVQPGIFQVVDGTSGGRFLTDRQILDSIDRDPRDGKISRREVLDFFHTSADRNLARFYATLHVSEWTANPSWVDALALSTDFEGMNKEEIEELVAEQIEPTLWWTDEVAQHARLPRDGVVYHYNPIAFVEFINQKLMEANVLADVGAGAFSAAEAREKPDDVLGDIDDVAGDSFVDPSELVEEDFGHDLGLAELADGFDD
jgi:N-acetyl-anhydromuramyl-L-alanine amidase AmpD